MSEKLIFPSKVMEHLSEDQIELLYDRYLKKDLTKELMVELNVKCHISHVLSHFPYVEVDTEQKCGYCDGKIFARRKNFVGNGVDWGMCGDCNHKIYLKNGDPVQNCLCNECKEMRAAQERYRKEAADKLADNFWQEFQQNNSIAIDECGILDDLTPLDVFITHLLIQSGCIDENGILDPISHIQNKLLLCPTLDDFESYITRMFDGGAIGYAWTEQTKNTILATHANPLDQKEYLEHGSYWHCFESVHLKLTIKSTSEECDCNTIELQDQCGQEGCRVARYLRPEEISHCYDVFVAPPYKICINSEKEFWETIESLQLMQLRDFLRIQEKMVDFPIVPEELPTIYETIASVLKRYSPSQCAYFIQKALKDAVVFYRSENCKGKTHACRTIKNNITRLMQKASSEGWELTSYRRLKYSVVPKVAQSYYSDVLGFIDDNDPSWYMSVEDIRNRFPEPIQSSPCIDITDDAKFMSLTDDGTPVFTKMLEDFTCANCNIKGSMQIGTYKVERLLLHCVTCKATYRYKLFDTL